MKKPLLALVLFLMLLLTACAPGQAPETSPAPEPESPSSVSEPAPEPEAEPEPSQPEISEPEPESEAESAQPEEPSSEPSGPWENPDTDPNAPNFGNESYADVVRQRAIPLRRALETALEAIKEDYSFFDVSVEDGSLDVVLEIGVINEEAVDQFLTGWTGPSWDKVEKKPGNCSVAKKEAFIQAVEQLELEPGIHAYVNSYPFEETLLVGVRKKGGEVTQEEEERWEQLPQAIKDLALETGVPEELLDYRSPRYRSALALNPD